MKQWLRARRRAHGALGSPGPARRVQGVLQHGRSPPFAPSACRCGTSFSSPFLDQAVADEGTVDARGRRERIVTLSCEDVVDAGVAPVGELPAELDDAGLGGGRHLEGRERSMRAVLEGAEPSRS